MNQKNLEHYKRHLGASVSATRASVSVGARRVILVAGARPNFVKLAPLYAELSERSDRFEPKIVHTGQHYDARMSDVFFDQLGIPKPHVYLGVGSGTHAEQTAKVMVEMERILLGEQPDLVVVFGDINSTLAASITAAKLRIPVAHVEAGLRSFDRTMPEEINRLVADALADILLTPSKDANRNLEREGTPREKIDLVGNIMIDTLVRNLPKADTSTILDQLEIEPRHFALMTMHRPGNVDDTDTVNIVLDIIEALTEEFRMVFPIHPRTKKNFVEIGGRAAKFVSGKRKNLIITEPLGYLDFLKLQKESGVTLTDSGGVQEETTFLGAPCLTLRPNTERPITITHGTNNLIGLDAPTAIEHARRYLRTERPPHQPPPLWDGSTAARIADCFERYFFEGDFTRELNAVSTVAREEAIKALTE